MIDEGNQFHDPSRGESEIQVDRKAPAMAFTIVQQKVLEIAGQLMARHYLLDTEDLYKECVKLLKSVGKDEIIQTINGLVHKKILVDGAARTRDDILNNSNRSKLFTLIQTRPGIHFSKLMEIAKMDSRTLQWHLSMLLKFDFIRVTSISNKLVYFDLFLEKNHDLLYYYLQKEGCHDIFRAILENEGMSFSKLLGMIRMPRSTLLRRIKMLINADLITSGLDSREMNSLKVHASCLSILTKMLYIKEA